MMLLDPKITSINSAFTPVKYLGCDSSIETSMGRHCHRLTNDQTWDIVAKFDSAFTVEAARDEARAAYGPGVNIVGTLRRLAHWGYLRATVSKGNSGESILFYTVVPSSTYTKNVTKLGSGH